MCRWIAYISPTEPCLLEDLLVTPKHSLCKQVDKHYLPGLLPHDHDGDAKKDLQARNIFLSIDGIGVLWYTSARSNFEQGRLDEVSYGEEPRPAFYKSVQPPLHDISFRSICANTETKVCFGHIRDASGTALAAVNSHPFIFGRHSFMHNGTINKFIDIRRAVSAEMSQSAFAGVFGTTDSEHMAGLYMTYLTKGGDATSFEKEYSLEEMAEAMHKAVATLIGIQHKLFGAKKPPNSLNFCTSDGVKMVAYRFRNHATSQPPSLYYSTKAGTTLNRKYPDHPDGTQAASQRAEIPEERHGRHIIVASEPSTYKASDWELIGKNQCLLVDSNGKFEIRDAPYGTGWDGVDS